jgi:squalene-hopene/tetraprenyl-beta-curcumene cyclase
MSTREVKITAGAIALFGWLVTAAGQGDSGARAEDAVPSRPAKPAAAAPVVPAPNRADEPFAKELSLSRAAAFLDATSVNWTRKHRCGTCHTNYPYLMGRPALKDGDGAALAEVRRFFEKRAAHWDRDKPRWDTEVVATAAALAFNDAQTTGKLHPLTRQALDRMWALQRADGSWEWLKCNWPPAEADDYYGVVFAALGVGAAPDGYAKTGPARAGLAKLRVYLKKHEAPSLHHETVLLWAASYLPDLLSDEQRQRVVRRLLALQRPDGGWSLPALGGWKRHSGEPNDARNAPSDGYATGLVVLVLRRSGLPCEDKAVRHGAVWLRTHQRASGRWFTRSLSTDRDHYITNAGTAYAVLALRAAEGR